ncbi:CU044_5270 family protein [Sinosporangium siamense]|uniref:CU044_5270 family protein n=1 Tax=Sinosporangium siamense TaxID=1367973 RepID=A0A919RJD4_9ACTN|nr:CU044_5270 family protein [Sinosporangium siamense]GII94718.1 hypothetical protein Ssi02_49490 [Sinosporangium siamense]
MDEADRHADPSAENEMAVIRRLLEASGPLPEATEAGRARLLSAIAGELAGETEAAAPGWIATRRRRTSRWRGVWALTAGAAAALLLTVTVTSSDSLLLLTPQATVSASAGPTARQVLLAAATAVAKSPGEGVYWRSRTVTGALVPDPSRRYVLRFSMEKQAWLTDTTGKRSWWIEHYLGAKPATPPDEYAWRAAGSPTRWHYPAVDGDKGSIVEPAGTWESGPREPEATALDTAGILLATPTTWAEVKALPGDPARLRSFLEARIRGQAAKGPRLNQTAEMEVRLQRSCMEILSGLPVSPEVRASAYQILASLPGIKADGEVVDPLGRTGQGLRYEVLRSDQSKVSDVRYVIDPESGMPLSSETTGIRELANGRTVEVGSYQAYVEMGWTDDKPELPESAQEEPAEKPQEESPSESQEEPAPEEPDLTIQ